MHRYLKLNRLGAISRLCHLLPNAMSDTCSVCLETYHRDTNPAHSCNPCGHVACHPCLTNWFCTNRRTCPECRTPVTSTTINRALMEMIERSDSDQNSPRNESDNNTSITGNTTSPSRTFQVQTSSHKGQEANQRPLSKWFLRNR